MTSSRCLLLFLGIVTSHACAARVPHDAGPVLGRVAGRAGVPAPAEMRAGGEPVMPPGVTLQDGLTADEAVALALWNSPRFRASLSALDLAEADIVEAGVLRNPILSLLFPWGPKQLEFTVKTPLEAFWLRPRRITAARVAYRAVAERLVQDGLVLVRDVLIAHADALAAGERTRLSTEAARLAREIATITGRRVRAGDISELEAALAFSDADMAEQGAIRARHEVEAARARVASIVGLDAATANPSAIRSTREHGCAAAGVLMKDALASRPELRAAEIEIEAAAARAGIARAQAVAISGVLDANAQGKDGFELGPGAEAELPVFGINPGGRARAAAELERATRVYLATRQQVLEDVRRAHAQWAAAEEIAAGWRTRIVPAIEREASQARSAFEAGDTSRLAMLVVERRLAQARLMQQDAEADVHRAAAALEFSVGKRCGS